MNALFTADFDEEGAGLPNVVEELAMFEHAGVGLAREEGYRLFLAMVQLKQAHGLASIRLFGKVLGTTRASSLSISLSISTRRGEPDARITCAARIVARSDSKTILGARRSSWRA